MAYALVGGSLPFAAEDPGALQHQIKFSKQSYAGKVSGWLGGSIDRSNGAGRAKGAPWMYSIVFMLLGLSPVTGETIDLVS